MGDAIDLDSLTDISRDFARAFLARFPALSASCTSETLEGFPGRHLVIRIESPAGADRDVTIWMHGGDEPSLAFGPGGWHVHMQYVREVEPHCLLEESLLDLLDAIRRDEFVVLEDPGAEPRPFADVVDLREPNALLEALTWPGAGDRIRIHGFTGERDRVVTPDDLDDRV